MKGYTPATPWTGEASERSYFVLHSNGWDDCNGSGLLPYLCTA